MAVHQCDCVLNIAQCHQFLIYKQVTYQECDAWEECPDRCGYDNNSKINVLNPPLKTVCVNVTLLASAHMPQG